MSSYKSIIGYALPFPIILIFILAYKTEYGPNLLRGGWLVGKYKQAPIPVAYLRKTENTRRNCHKEKQRKVTKILLISNFRSGSSWIGQLLEKAPESFYLFEPLHFWNAKYKNKHPNFNKMENINLDFEKISPENSDSHKISQEFNNTVNKFKEFNEMNLDSLIANPNTNILNSSKSNVTDSGNGLNFSKNYNLTYSKNNFTFHKSPGQFLDSLFSCQFETDFKNHIRKIFPVILPSCINNTKTENKGRLMSACFENMTENCLKASLRVIKTVRFPLQGVEDMLISDPNLKVVFLYRDPRASLHSIRQLKMTVHSDNVCRRLDHDSESYSQLHREYPGKIYALRYEDIARDPIDESNKLWQFISVKTTPNPPPIRWQSFIEHSAGYRPPPVKNADMYNPEKGSTSNWQNWRLSITKKVLAEATLLCKNVLAPLGYKYFKYLEEVRNLNVSVLMKEKCDDIPCNY